MDKQRKKQLKKEYKEAEIDSFKNSFPIRQDKFQELYNSIEDSKIKKDILGVFEFAEKHQIDISSLNEALRS